MIGRILAFLLRQRPGLILERYGDPQSCLAHLERSRRTVLELSTSLDDLTFLRQPDPETWSPGMVLEHIALSDIKYFAPTLHKLRLVAGGNPQQFETLPAIHLSWNARATTLPSLKPSVNMLRPELMAFLDTSRALLLQEMKKWDGLEHPATAAHPLFGNLSARRWCQLAAFHERHHLEQLNRVVARNRALA